MSILVALVEDNPTLRKRFEEQFKLFPDIRLAFSCASGEEVLRRLKRLPPSKLPRIVLMDIELPRKSGIETTNELKEIFPDIDVMMVTVFEDESKIFQSIQAGASGYLLKDESLNNIEQAIKELANGGAPMSQSIARTVLSFIRGRNVDRTTSAEPPDDVKSLLTDRELELLQGLVEGETYTSVAKKMFISPHTAKSYIKNIYRKLHVHSRALAVRVAIEKKLV
ncbi:MAG: response regulator transcription factor [Bacteroidetes bacterium]|nr:response regulator transcription factor [Bacteroidota bacterium]MCW5894409.1 response regulator transcription factor [Bacteroidota bacterium]